jgi:hypothetical protein
MRALEDPVFGAAMLIFMNYFLFIFSNCSSLVALVIVMEIPEERSLLEKFSSEKKN